MTLSVKSYLDTRRDDFTTFELDLWTAVEAELAFLRERCDGYGRRLFEIAEAVNARDNATANAMAKMSRRIDGAYLTTQAHNEAILKLAERVHILEHYADPKTTTDVVLAEDTPTAAAPLVEAVAEAISNAPMNEYDWIPEARAALDVVRARMAVTEEDVDRAYRVYPGCSGREADREGLRSALADFVEQKLA